MTYTIKRYDDFVKDLSKLDKAVKDQLRKKLEKIVENPHIPKNWLGGELSGLYKIKLQRAGICLVYAVNDDEIYILLLTVGKRADSEVYETAKTWLWEQVMLSHVIVRTIL